MLQQILTLQENAGENEARMEEMFNSIKDLNSGSREVSELAVTAHCSIEKISDIVDGYEV
jgi:methyl-accepting chemotaxis protein